MISQEIFEVFLVCFTILCLNIVIILKIEDKLIPALFMLFATIVYTELFQYASDFPAAISIAILFIALSIYLNAKGSEVV